VYAPLFGEDRQDASEETQIFLRLRPEIMWMPPQVKDASIFGRRSNSARDAAQPNRLKTFSLSRVRPKKHARTNVEQTVRLRNFVPA
jgi:hypothetical protein